MATVELWGGRLLVREEGHLAALFGLGDPDGRDTEMATRCALVALRGLEPARAFGDLGCTLGRVVVSSAGEPAEDDRLGSLFDTARDLARVREGHASMSTQAMRQVKALFEFEPLGDADRPPSSVAAVVVKEVRGPGEAFGRFVGRKEELRRIGLALALAARRSAQVLTIRGDHGVGKTRLLYEAERRLRKGGYDVGFHVAVCPPRGNDFPLSGVLCMVQALCGTSEGDAPERVLAVKPRLRALGLQEDEVRAVLMALGAGVTTAATDTSALLRQAFTRMVQSLCADRPHMFAWDGAHAMDEDSYAALGEVRARCDHARAVFVLAVRAGFSHPLETGEGHGAIELGDLAPQEVERLVALRLGIGAAPEALLRFIRARAGGHPLFVEEMLKALVDEGAVTVEGGRIAKMKLVGQDLALPKTLRGLVASRVARLSPEDRAVLQAAAVLGDPIDLPVLAHMLGQAMPAVEKAIATLAARDFVVHTGPSELRFTSPIVPEVVGDVLTPQSAREMHAAAGRALEVVLGDRAIEHAGRIAGHLYEAGDRERAAGYFGKSGERRLATRQLEAAARDCALAIALSPTPSSARRLEEPRDVARAAGVGVAPRSLVVRRAGPLRPSHRPRRSRGHRRRARPGQGRGAEGVLAAVHQLEDARLRLRWRRRASPRRTSSSPSRVLLAEAELSTAAGRLPARVDPARGASAPSSTLRATIKKSTGSRSSSRSRTPRSAIGPPPSRASRRPSACSPPTGPPRSSASRCGPWSSTSPATFERRPSAVRRPSTSGASWGWDTR